MSAPREILIEGYTPAQVLSLPDETLEKWMFTGSPVVFRAGSAEILGEFRITEDKLTVELAQIEGGGEGVLPTLWVLAARYASKRDLDFVEWIVHAVNCSKPNPKLKRVLERRGFEIHTMPGGAKAYQLMHTLSKPLSQHAL